MRFNSKENLNNIWFQQKESDILDLSGNTNIKGGINISGKLKLKIDNNKTIDNLWFNYIENKFINLSGETINSNKEYLINNKSFLNINKNKSLIIGNNNFKNIIINNNIGLGIENPIAIIDIFATGNTNGFRLIDGNQQNDYILTTDNNGIGKWKPKFKSFNIKYLSNGKNKFRHNLNMIPSNISFYGNNQSQYLKWSYDDSGLDQYNEINIYTNEELINIIINII